jgi:hypothetical protein
MKNKPVYKPLAKTVVTEIKHAIVDTVRRVGQSHHTVATKISRDILSQTEVIVGPDKTYTLKDVHNIVSIFAPHPIVAEFVGFGTIPEEESTTEQIFFDAVLTVGRADAGRFVQVFVEDLDMFTEAPLECEVVNMRTGETEYFEIRKESEGIYAGFFQTQNNDATGTNFDGVLYVRESDTLRITYNEAFAANGKSREVIQEVVVTLDFKPTVLECPETIPFNALLAIRVLNPVGSRVKVQNMRTLYSIEQHIGTYQPILMAYEDGPLVMDVQDNDTLMITTLGKDSFGQDQIISRNIHIASAPVAATIDVASVADVKQRFLIKVQDDNLPATARVKITNGNTSNVSEMGMIEAYPNSGQFSLELDSLTYFGLPGQLLVMSYETAQGLTVQKNVSLVMTQTEECKEVVPSAPVSNPVVFNINGLFTLNGSFAGTIKLSAPDLVRCTIIKA